MSRMTTRSMTRAKMNTTRNPKFNYDTINKVKNEERNKIMDRRITRSMCDYSNKRFHEDPYPQNKRQRIQQEQDGACLAWMMLMLTLVNTCVFLSYCYLYKLEVIFKA